MSRKIIITIGCFIYLLSPIFCTSVGLSIESGTSSTLQYVTSGSIGPAFQPSFAVFARGSVDLNDTFSLQLALAAHSAIQSAPNKDLLFYRGYAGFGWTGALGFHPFRYDSADGWSLRGGVRLEGGFTLSQYTDTQLYFVYPSAGVRPEIDLRFPGGIGLFLDLPVRLDFRRDLTFAISGGISIGVRVRPVEIPLGGKETRA